MDTKTMNDRFLHGVIALFAGHALQVALYAALAAAWNVGTGAIPDQFFVIIGFGIIQFVYLVPLLIFAAVTGRRKMAISLVVGGLFTGVLNALVVGVIFSAGGHLVP